MCFLSLSNTCLHSHTLTRTHTHTHTETTVHDTIVLDDETDSYSDWELYEFSCVSDSDADDENYEYSYTLKLVNPACKKTTLVELGREKRVILATIYFQEIVNKSDSRPQECGYGLGHGLKRRKMTM